VLVLTRRKGEAIIVGDNVEIRVLEVSRHQVKLGVQAPRTVPIYRSEIYEKVRDANRAAASSSDSQVLGLGKLFGT
jgi:carbon storage regulator